MVPLRIAFRHGRHAGRSRRRPMRRSRNGCFGDTQAEREQPCGRRRAKSSRRAIGRGRSSGDFVRQVVRRRRHRHRDRVWRAIEATPNFWTTLRPIDAGAVKRLYQLTGEHNWEVFFITQRPATAGETVQWQTHNWLVEQGFLTAQRDPVVARSRPGRGGSAPRLPRRRHAAELRGRAV